jgi:hypothetical protein
MNDDLKSLLSRPTASVPETGRICFGYGINASYRAAERGTIPTIKIGGKLRVPTAWIKRTLQLDAADLS